MNLTQNAHLDETDKAILNQIQSSFPLTPRPYAAVGELLGLTEAEVVSRVQRMMQDGIIRRIGANFNSRRLGYTSTLCAAHVPPDQIEQFIQVVNQFPGGDAQLSAAPPPQYLVYADCRVYGADQ